ncbi:Putative exporter of polyketide antibiotics- like protein [Kribbella flavida DSM 17836]|uniref:Putative exporter of polyketide antibiotics-like protein n=1 Tax=Kribbella flavida (strain DSM 17836 / JCM 10339 / NBRC 14399) TaxID=479435 RepID=D2PVT4_KRIFD|nr:exporter of polyketide antibiotics-like protein [Kribbella flavida]ADB29591.1 Putative exporter of polyketide antibiotics- like protein [Kribbella flavida DSM 17836]
MTGPRDSLTGTGHLIRLALRRDRVKLPIWVLAIGLGMQYAVSALGTVYSTPQERQVRAELMESPAATMMSGPGYGLNDYTLGAMISNEMVLWLAIPAAMMSIFLVIRHTRSEEETGRAELVRSAVVGRHAAPVAALVLAVAANAGIALLTALALIGGDLAAADAFAVGLGLGLTGLVFAGVATVTAQLTEHARSASSMAMAVLGAAFLVRAIGDAAGPGGSLLSWFSPLAWVQQQRPFVDLRWWPLLLPLVLVAAMTALAYALSARRDVGAGLLRARLGRPTAPRSLSSPFGLAVRQQRTSVIGWAIGLLVFAVPTGSLSDSVTEAALENPDMAEVFTANGQEPTDGFYATMAMFFALLIAAFAVTSVLRLRSEERTGHAEAALATAVSRRQWVSAWLGVTVLSSVVLLVVSGLGVGLGALSGDAPTGVVGEVLLATLAFFPPVLVVVGLAAALFGLRAGLAMWAWALVGYAFLFGMFGALLDLPAVFTELSPFSHLTVMPLDRIGALPLVTLSAVAAVLVLAGGLLFRRRDLDLR